MAGSLAAVHLENTLRAEAAARHERFDADLEHIVLERLELVEERHDEGRHDEQRQEMEGYEDAPDRDPPESTQLTHGVIDGEDERRHEGDRQQDRLGEV